MYHEQRPLEGKITLFVDFISISASLFLAYSFRYGSLSTAILGTTIFQMLFIINLLFITISFFTDNYHQFCKRGHLIEIVSVIKAHSILAASIAIFLYITKQSTDFARLVFGFFITVDIVLMFLFRTCLKLYLVHIYKTGIHSNRIMLVTTRDRAPDIIRNLKQQKEWIFTVTCIAVTDADSLGSCIEGIPVTATSDTMYSYAQFHEVDQVLIHLPEADSALSNIVKKFEIMGIVVNVSIQLFDLDVPAKKSFGQIGSYHVVTYARNIIPYHQLILKRGMDMIGSSVGILLLAVAFVIVAPAIKLESPGPIFFGQTRIGKNGRKFKIYKFRSMYQDAEARKKELMQFNEMKGLMFKMDQDPRITRVGRFLRRTSIDELPQFWNILKGDMSLVGTRPPTEDEFNQYEPDYKCRLSMTPGLTGMWQISGRSSIKDFSDVMKLDLKYIDNWSLALDIKILFQTVKTVVMRVGAG